MILNKTWNKKNQKLTISYIDKNGGRQFYTKYLNFIESYEYDENGEFMTWDGKKCSKVWKSTKDYVPNEFEFFEYMYNIQPEIRNQLYAQNFPRIAFFDIETEVSNEFPDPWIAAQKVTAISVVNYEMSCIVYGLKKLTDEQIETLRKRYLDWIDNNEFASIMKAKLYSKSKDRTGPKVLYKYFNSESEMLRHFITVIIPKIPILCGWNSQGFDWPYIVNRCYKLFGKQETIRMIYKASPTNEMTYISWKDMNKTKYSIPVPCHSEILDYMEIVKQYDYVLRPYESYSLDYVGSRAINAHKVKYEGTLQQLYERDPEWYYFYNAIDSLIGLLIHYKLKSIESPCATSSITLVTLRDAFGQIALGTANVFRQFYDDNLHVVYDYDSIKRYKQPYEGAFCGAVPGKWNYTVCYDFASLYPSQVRTCNFSFENIVKNTFGPDSLGRYTEAPWTEADIERFKQDPNYFVSVMGNVYKNDKDYTFRKVQAKLKANRDQYKYTGQKIEAELLTEIDKLIEEKSA